MMPLPNIFKNIIGSGDNNEKAGHFNQKSSSYNTNQQQSFSSKKFISNFKSSPSIKQKSLSQITGLHSHRNLKSSHQMILAESMYDPNHSVSLDSCLSCNFQQCLSDNYILPYFVQFMESLGKSNKNLIKCFLQTNCLMVSINERYKDVDFNEIQDSDTIALEENDKKYIAQFIDDFLQLFNQFLVTDSDHYVEINDDLYNNLHLFFENFEQTEFSEDFCLYPFKLFYLFWNYLCNQIETTYFELFLRSNFFLKYEYELLKGNMLGLSDILLSNTEIASTFLDFINSEGMKNYVDFLLMYKNYKTYSCHYSDALAIYNRFFNCSNKSSISFLHFSDTILDELKVLIKKENFSPDCFDKIASILIQYFSKTYLPQFFQSEAYREYTQNCLIKLNPDKNGCKPQNQNLISAQIQKLSSGVCNLSSHTNAISDSESLWKRDLKGQLQFTHIDNYGRINSLLEPEPAKSVTNGGGKLTQVIRKFTFNSSEDKEKEDNAWKIAESIINDVCSVTNYQTDLNSLN